MKKIEINDEVITRMSELLFIASDETRLKIMCALLEKEKCVSEIEYEVGASQSLVSHQLRVLRNADLVTTRKEKNFVYYSLDDEHVEKLISVVYSHATEALK